MTKQQDDQIKTAEQPSQNELDNLIAAYTAPTPNQKVVFSDYEAKKKPKHNQQQNQSGEIAELEPPMVREFAIHILQTIHFLQNMSPIDESEWKSKQVELPLTKRDQGIKKVLLFDLDETLAHCVRHENPD